MGTSLSYANPNGADSTGADLTDADLTNAVISPGVRRLDIEGAPGLETAKGLVDWDETALASANGPVAVLMPSCTTATLCSLPMSSLIAPP